ncbi:MAG: phenylalanine--tRNA ligase subunit beta, partial [Actinobacteria bacterium]|nr:phenylalanine--tRNA ligase subunit beta [Actinomycetota bacterium]
MKVTLNWLKEFLYTDKCPDPAEIAELLTMSGTEVKKVEYLGDRYKNMVVGKILEYSRHPNADKLTVCKVDTDKNVLNIVCGATNFKKNDKVVVALEGAVTAQGLTINRSKIRSVYSEGMLCSEAELGISEDADGIMILNPDSVVGEDFSRSEGLDDAVFELEITPNRPDCLCVMGIAREISALKGIPLRTYNYEIDNELNPDRDFEIEIEDYTLCPRYSAKVFSDIPGIGSPEWLKKRLILCDYRPIDLVVDLTNYVMHEVGQPLHAFDKDLLSSNKIVVRVAKNDEHIRTIDDVSRRLNKNMLVIADEKKAVAIAGVMGGKDTEINYDTKNVFLESANFYGPSIMRTSNALGLRSEASNRFEKKIDPEITVIAIKRFEELLSKITGCSFKKGIYDNYKKAERIRTLNLNLNNIKNILGEAIPADEVCTILNGLDIKCKYSGDSREIIKAAVPSSRFEDIEREIDLIEEIARIHGFEKIKSEPPESLLRRGKYTFYQKTLKSLRLALCSAGLDEVMNYSFISREWFNKFKLAEEEKFKDYVSILNPINEDFALLRTTPLPHMVKNLLNNFYHGIKNISIFEITKVFKNIKDSKLPEERNMLGVLISGQAVFKSWAGADRNYGFYDLKGMLEYLTAQFYKNHKLQLLPKEYKFFHPVISSDILINDINMGIIGKLHPAIADALDISQEIFYFEINIDSFINNIKYTKEFKPISSFPSIDVDLALVVGE